MRRGEKARRHAEFLEREERLRMIGEEEMLEWTGVVEYKEWCKLHGCPELWEGKAMEVLAGFDRRRKQMMEGMK